MQFPVVTGVRMIPCLAAEKARFVCVRLVAAGEGIKSCWLYGYYKRLHKMICQSRQVMATQIAQIGFEIGDQQICDMVAARLA